MSDTRARLRRAAKQTPPTQFLNCKAFLKSLHAQMKEEKDGYSFRQMADDLGFSATNVVHLFAQGKRPVTDQAGRRISDALLLRKEQKHYFQKICRLSQNLTVEEFAQVFSEALDIRASQITDRLAKEQLQFYSNWANIVIREMLALPDFQCDAKWISQRLWPRITVKEAEEALDLLKNLELIIYDESAQNWVQANKTVSTGPEVAWIAVNQYHQLSIPQGLRSLVDIEQKKRHISSLTLCINEDQFELVKKEIEAFQQRLLELEKQTEPAHPPDRVVQLNMQLFPNTTD